MPRTDYSQTLDELRELESMFDEPTPTPADEDLDESDRVVMRSSPARSNEISNEDLMEAIEAIEVSMQRTNKALDEVAAGLRYMAKQLGEVLKGEKKPESKTAVQHVEEGAPPEKPYVHDDPAVDEAFVMSAISQAPPLPEE